MKKKVIIAIIVILLIFIIGLLIIGGIYLSKDRYSLTYINSDSDVAPDTKFADNIIIFFAGYTGKLYPETIYKSMYDTCNNVIPKLYSDLKGKSSEEISNYFNNNNKYILEKLGIENEEDFTKLVSKINSFQGDKIVYEKSSVDVNSINHLNNRSTMNLQVIYSQNNTLNLKLTVKRYSSDERSPIKYTAIELIDY